MAEQSKEERILAEIRTISRVMDTALRIPGTNVTFGLDAALGLIPGAGDAVGLLISIYPLIRAWQLGVRTRTLAKMIGNIVIDAAVGSVPLAGDVFDIFFKANRRNLDLVLSDFEKTRSES